MTASANDSKVGQRLMLWLGLKANGFRVSFLEVWVRASVRRETLIKEGVYTSRVTGSVFEFWAEGPGWGSGFAVESNGNV